MVMSSNQSQYRLSRLPRVDLDASSRAEQRACNTVVRLKVHFDVVVISTP